MNNLTKEYREWLIAELNNYFPRIDTDRADDNRLVALYEGLGCLMPQASHTARNTFKPFYMDE